MSIVSINDITNGLFDDEDDFDLVTKPVVTVTPPAVEAAVDLAVGLETPLDHAQAFAKAIMGDGQLHGVRVLYNAGKEVALTREGLFADPAALAKAVLAESDKKQKNYKMPEERYPSGVYILANPQKQSALSKMEVGLMKIAPKGESISDNDVDFRQALLIDIDSIKDPSPDGKGVAGISATDAEAQMAVDVAGQIVEMFSALGWPKPIRCFSGNGAHVLYRINLENTEANTKLINSTLMSIKNTFKDNITVGIDTTVSNAARIWKMPGTMSRKGKDTADRPHRLARVTSLPSDWRQHVVTGEQLKAFVISNGDDKAKHQIGVELPRATAIAPRSKTSAATVTNSVDFAQVNEQMIADQRWIPDLLASVSPSGERGQWLSTMRAIRGLDGTGAGMQVFQEWSQRHDSGYGDMTAMSDWTSLDGDEPNKALQVLMARAKESGWTYRAWCKQNGVAHPKSKGRQVQDAQMQRQHAPINEDKQEVLDRLLMSRDKKNAYPLATDANHTTIIMLDGNLSKTFCYDMFTRTVMVMNSGGKSHLTGPFPREIRDEDYSHLSLFIQSAYDMSASSITCRASVDAVARMPINRFDSLRDKLLGLKWDGVKRLDTFGVDYLNVEDTTFNQYATKRFMIAAAARALDENPNGTKVDCCLILEGKQGFCKSEAIRTLSFHKYTNAVKPDPENKDNFLKMRGVMMAEFGEFEQYVATDKSDSKLKDFMSTNVDTFREPYKSQTESFNRRFVFVGTTNEENYLKDPTGNRRYWPVTVQSRIDLEKLERDLEQLWAEAVECFRDFQDAKEDGVPKDKNVNRWWFEDSEEMSAQAAVAEGRVLVDAWEDELKSKLGTKDETTSMECGKILCIPVENYDRAKQTRVAQCLKRLGFHNKVKKSGTKSLRVWIRG